MENLNEILTKINASWGIAGILVFNFLGQNFVWPHVWKFIKIKYLKQEWISWEDINVEVKKNVEDIEKLNVSLNGHLKQEELEEVRFTKLELEQSYAKERREEDIKLLEKFEKSQRDVFHLIGEIKDRMIDRRNG